jgi:hypothetical protein
MQQAAIIQQKQKLPKAQKKGGSLAKHPKKSHLQKFYFPKDLAKA